MSANKISEYALRLGLAFAFLYPAVSSFLDPNSWIGFFPFFLRDNFPHQLLLSGFSLFEIAVALTLLFLKNPFYPSLLAAIVLAAIILLNLPEFPILFRDLTILLAALSLAFFPRGNQGDTILGN